METCICTDIAVGYSINVCGRSLVGKSEKEETNHLVGGAASLLPLLFFKYFNFINESIYELLESIGFRYELHGLNWVIPVGISFYTFQALGYLYDVYYKRIPVERDLYYMLCSCRSFRRLLLALSIRLRR